MSEINEVESGNAQEIASDMHREFEKNARGIARQFSLDFEDVKATYQSRPESLHTIFNSMNDARIGRNLWIALSLVCLIIIPPVAKIAALFTGYKAWDSIRTLDNIENQVKKEVKGDSAAFKDISISTPEATPG